MTLSTLTSTEATHCFGQSLNSPQWALPFYYAAPSTSWLYNQCFPSDRIHSQPINPCWLDASAEKPGKGWWGWGRGGVTQCPCSGEAICTHSPNLWHSAVLEVDCVARLLSLLQIMSHHNRNKLFVSRTIEAASSSSLTESKPRVSCDICVYTAEALSHEKDLQNSRWYYRG